MNFIENFTYLFSDYTLRTISMGTALLGAICGMLGSFAVLRKQSLLGDTISHAALPGITIAFLITQSKETEVLLMGALISGLIGAALINSITKHTHLKTDTALGLILSLFFGVGILILTFIQKMPNANQAGLDKFLFGQAATLLQKDVFIIGVTALITVLILIVFWKSFKIYLFDKDYTHTLGFNTNIINSIITVFIVMAIVLGLQTVGVVLMSALLLAPAAAARQWTNRLSTMIVLAAIFGSLSGVLGTVVSASQDNISTGPTIVLTATVFVIISFVFAPSRGIIAKQLKLINNRKKLTTDKTLGFMFFIAKEHCNKAHPHEIKLLNNFKGFTKKTLNKLENKNLIEVKKSKWNLTDKGILKAEKIYSKYYND
jgi:manganese/zinc/iron transport system permease protein